MARLVNRLRNRPYVVTIGGESKHFCGCGLSSTQPFCNGTHKITRTEEPDKLYWYSGNSIIFVDDNIREHHVRTARPR